MIRGNVGLGTFLKRNSLNFFKIRLLGWIWCSLCRKMQPQQGSRIDLGDLKAQIVKKLGADRSKWYFYHLNRLLSQNLSKTIFDKLCLRVLGKENLHLHNQFIRSILKNACQAKTPPPLHVSSQSKSVAQASNSSPGRGDDHELSEPGFSTQSLPIWSNGVLPVSPRKGKSGIRDRKLKNRHRLLGPNGKVEYVKNQTVSVDDAGDKAVASNGDVSLCDYRRPLQQCEAVQRISSEFQTESTINEDAREMERSNPLSLCRSPLLAPLGIPFCSASVGAARKGFSFGGRVDSVSFYDNNELSDDETLRRRMDQIVKAQGLEGVSSECAIVLNNMLNLYLKRMISSCIELVGVRSTYEPKRQLTPKPHIQKKAMNGAWPSNDLNIRSNSPPADITQEQRPWCSVSLLDFKIAMELNPKQLGEDWPMMLEKISTLSFEE